MAQNDFGRRQSTFGTRADGLASRSDAPASGTTAVRSMGILAAVGGLVVIVAIGGAVALNAATGAGSTTSTQPPVAAFKECRGQADCANRYSVALSCGSTDARTVSVVARDPEAAQRKAERYNRDCRSRTAVFVTNLVRSTGVGAARMVQAQETPRRISNGGGRTRFRFRRR